ncbi:hypothetical protein MRX96_007554 [Rhipicephalus microplus]
MLEPAASPWNRRAGDNHRAARPHGVSPDLALNPSSGEKENLLATDRTPWLVCALLRRGSQSGREKKPLSGALSLSPHFCVLDALLVSCAVAAVAALTALFGTHPYRRHRCSPLGAKIRHPPKHQQEWEAQLTSPSPEDQIELVNGSRLIAHVRGCLIEGRVIQEEGTGEGSDWNEQRSTYAAARRRKPGGPTRRSA